MSLTKYIFITNIPIPTSRLRSLHTGPIQQTLHRTYATQSTPESQPGTKQTLTLSDACRKKLSELTKDNKPQFLRIIVDGGGCSGFQYKFELDDKLNEDDVEFGDNNSKVVIDTVSLEYCAGSTIDYHSELIKSGFRVIGNPKAEQGCGCGASFALKLD